MLTMFRLLIIKCNYLNKITYINIILLKELKIVKYYNKKHLEKIIIL